MTTYYGVWSGQSWGVSADGEWWRDRDALFYTPAIGLAKAQAMVANSLWEGMAHKGCWQARVIGEDGLPESKLGPSRSEPRLCEMCGERATEYVDVHVRGWMCEQHSHVKVGSVSSHGANEYAIVDGGKRKFAFDTQQTSWIRTAVEEKP